MGQSQEPFTPGTTLTISATTTSGTTSRTALSKARNQQIRISAPAGGGLTFIKFGDSTVSATTSDTPILPGTVEIFTVGEGITNMAAITSATTQTIYATQGDGN